MSKKIRSFSAAFLKIHRKAAEKPAFTQSCGLFSQGILRGLQMVFRYTKNWRGLNEIKQRIVVEIKVLVQC